MPKGIFYPLKHPHTHKESERERDLILAATYVVPVNFRMLLIVTRMSVSIWYSSISSESGLVLTNSPHATPAAARDIGTPGIGIASTLN